MKDAVIQDLASLSTYLAARRNVILGKLRMAADADPEQTTVNSLTRSQFNDHIPQILDAFEEKLCARPGGSRALAADKEKKGEEMKHGLHRWQQGYLIRELLHEWGHLHFCLFEELGAFAAANPDVSRETMIEAHRQLIAFVNEAISESTGQYVRLQQAEAAGHLRDIQLGLSRVHDLESSRAALMHEAVHDIQGNVLAVTLLAGALAKPGAEEAKRMEYANLVQQGVESVSALLGDLMTLARLEAGMDRREIAPFDVAKVLTDFCAVTQPVAMGRGLFLKSEGPATLPIEGDGGHVRRILQNLVLNSLKYTKRGGVTVKWGSEENSWWFIVKDTGPGLLAGPGAPMVVGLKEATASAHESDAESKEAQGKRSKVLGSPEYQEGPVLVPAHQQPGEGIGLSIVKRICELLDASLEMASSADTGTTFRVVLPRRYQAESSSRPTEAGDLQEAPHD